MICNESGCKRLRLLENECLYLRKAIKEYKCNLLNNDIVLNHLDYKLKAIVNKYKTHKSIITKVDCEIIENEIMNCYIALKTI